MTVFAATLRVYEPLAAFEGAEREHWEQYVRAGAQLPPLAACVLERAAGWVPQDSGGGKFLGVST